MNLSQHLLTQNDCYKAGVTIAPKGIMVHSLGVAQTECKRFLDHLECAGSESC